MCVSLISGTVVLWKVVLGKSYDTDTLSLVRELLISDAFLVPFAHHMNLCVAVLSGQWKVLLMKM